MNPKQYKALRLKYQMHHYRYYPTWKQRKRRQTMELWGVAIAIALATGAIILAMAEVWPV